MTVVSATYISINGEAELLGSIEVEYDGLKSWHGKVFGILQIGDRVTATIRHTADPDNVYVGEALVVGVVLDPAEEPCSRIQGNSPLYTLPRPKRETR